jgi:CRISPR-associated protein Csm2
MREAIQHLGKLDGLAEWDARNLVERADSIGRELKNKNVTTSQIRNFLDEVNRIEAENRRRRGSFDGSQVVFLDIQLAYAAGREDRLKDFARLFSAAIKQVRSKKDFDRFVKFTQAVVAYHRFHGGSNR